MFSLSCVCFPSETNQPNPAFVFVDFSQNELKPHWTANFAHFFTSWQLERLI